MGSTETLPVYVAPTFWRSRLRGARSPQAREVSRLTGWGVRIFADRYRLIMVSNEERAQVERLRYHLSHSCKENLVVRLGEWPGVHLVHAVENDGILKGCWFDRTQEYAAHRRGEKPEARNF